jgi:hypothetical protein
MNRAQRWTALLAAMLVQGCPSGQLSTHLRSPGGFSAAPWKVEIAGSESGQRTRPAWELSFFGHQEWTLRERLVVTVANDEYDLGPILQVMLVDGDAYEETHSLLEALQLASCTAPDGRFAFRLQGEPSSAVRHPAPGWWAGYALPHTFALVRDLVPGASCPEALAQVRPVEAWVREGLRTPQPAPGPNEPTYAVGRLAVRGDPEAAPVGQQGTQGVAFTVAALEGVALDEALSLALRDSTLASDAELERLPRADGDAPRFHAARQALLRALGEARAAQALIAALTPAAGHLPLEVRRPDDLSQGFGARIRWALALGDAVPRDLRADAVRAIVQGCSQPESRASCLPFSTWVAASWARGLDDAALCDQVLGLVPGLIEARVHALEWTALGALRGVGSCGTPEVRLRAARASLSPAVPIIPAETGPNAWHTYDSPEPLDTSPGQCRLEQDPVDVEPCRSLPGYARAVLAAP